MENGETFLMRGTIVPQKCDIHVCDMRTEFCYQPTGDQSVCAPCSGLCNTMAFADDFERERCYTHCPVYAYINDILNGSHANDNKPAECGGQMLVVAIISWVILFLSLLFIVWLKRVSIRNSLKNCFHGVVKEDHEEGQQVSGQEAGALLVDSNVSDNMPTTERFGGLPVQQCDNSNAEICIG